MQSILATVRAKERLLEKRHLLGEICSWLYILNCINIKLTNPEHPFLKWAARTVCTNIYTRICPSLSLSLPRYLSPSLSLSLSSHPHPHTPPHPSQFRALSINDGTTIDCWWLTVLPTPRWDTLEMPPISGMCVCDVYQWVELYVYMACI